MNTRAKRLLSTLFALGLFSMQAVADEPRPEVEDLGDGRYRVGAIEIDKEARRFTVPGTIIDLEENMPLEFLAIAKGGVKSYESLIELDVSAVEFNLACILIGLDADKATHPKMHFDPDPVAGDAVDVRVSWVRDGEEQSHAIERLLRGAPDAAEHVWVYTGSFFTPHGDYMAMQVGTLIGFVHDPESIIQHQAGLGIGNYGAITFDPEVRPPAGTPVKITLSRNPD